MKKLLILVVSIVIIAGIYFMLTKDSAIGPQSTNSQEIPQPPALPE